MESIPETQRGQIGFYLSLVPWGMLLIIQLTRPG